MKIREITLEEFKKEEARSGRGRRGGANLQLMERALHTPLCLEFDSAKKANSKLTALYSVRRTQKAQVKILKRDNLIFLAPGKYTPGQRKKKAQ